MNKNNFNFQRGAKLILKQSTNQKKRVTMMKEKWIQLHKEQTVLQELNKKEGIYKATPF